jgi:hypothetical protein
LVDHSNPPYCCINRDLFLRCPLTAAHKTPHQVMKPIKIAKENRVRTRLPRRKGLRVVADTPAIAATKPALFSLPGELNRFL